MNIFVLDENPKIAAIFHCNKHVLKMIIESAQLLSAAYYQIDYDNSGKWRAYKNKLSIDDLFRTHYPRESFIKLTHIHHPCVKFSTKSMENWNWLRELFEALLSEYTFRYKKTHAFQSLNDWFKLNPPELPTYNSITWVKAMPEYLKTIDNIVEAYREYYLLHKQHIAKWEPRGIPFWFHTI